MITSEKVQEDLDRSPDGSVTYGLEAGDEAWNPASTKRTIPGPAEIRYKQWADGGIDCQVTTNSRMARE